jgi:hypothetical protein
VASESGIRDLIARALNTDAPPVYEAHDTVRCMGEVLSKPVYWTGKQWAVTAFGIEARDGKYAIEGKRVWDEEEEYGWIRNMGEKEWVDMRDFAEALRLARKRWPRKALRKPASADGEVF